MKRLLPLILLAAGCGGGSDADPVITPTVFDPATLKSIRGRVKYAGEAPKRRPLNEIRGNPECSALHSEGEAFHDDLLVKDGLLQNAFVSVREGLDPAWVFDWPRDPVTIANEKCVYVPRIATARVHQPIRFVNNDPTLHNIHYFSRVSGDKNHNLFNKGSDWTIKLRKPEAMLLVKCDVHPWMIGYVAVMHHPFYALTGPDGTFEIRGLPPGDYTLQVWHEKLGVRQLKAAIKKDAPHDVEGVEFVLGEKQP